MISDYLYLKETFKRAEELPKLKNGHPRCNHSNTRWILIQNRTKELNINLEWLPVNASRRKSNTTIYNRITDVIYWRVEWRFGDTVLFSNDTEDCKTLGSVLYSVVNNYKQELSSILEAEPFIENLHLLMKVEHQPVVLTSYHYLDPHLSIRENLQGKIVIEYPCILVVLPSLLHNYKIKVAAEPAETISTPLPLNDLPGDEKNLNLQDEEEDELNSSESGELNPEGDDELLLLLSSYASKDSQKFSQDPETNLLSPPDHNTLSQPPESTTPNIQPPES